MSFEDQTYQLEYELELSSEEANKYKGELERLRKAIWYMHTHHDTAENRAELERLMKDYKP